MYGLLQATDISCRFGRRLVLDRVSIDVPRGGVTGVLGPNGSGKTTLLRILSGGLTPTGGAVHLEGQPLARLPRRERARRMAVVPQEVHPVFDCTVLDLALVGRYAHLGAFAFESAADLRVVRRALATTGTADFEDRLVDTLSGGEKQRVAIASALAQFDDHEASGRLLLLDEPTAALDLHYQLDVARLLRDLAAHGLTLVVSTHDLQFAAQVCDRVVLLQEGRVLAEGPTRETLTPSHLAALYGVDEAQVPRIQWDVPSTPALVPPPAPGPELAAAAVTATARRRAAWRIYLGFGAMLAATVLVSPLVGSTSLHLASVFDRSRPFADNLDAQIFFIARLPRVLAAALVGGTLAAAGVVLQALLRNPLATPFTLGVSSGSALGAMLAITFLPAWIGFGVSVPLASLAGSLGAVGIVYSLARLRHRGFSTDVLLLAGVTLNAFFSAVILLLQYFADFTQTVRTLRWLMGDLDVAGYRPIVIALVILAPAFAILAWLPRSLDALALGVEQARTRGVPVLTAQRLAFLASSLATGVAVSLAGPIGFVGIIVPHLVRLLVGSDHRVVLPASALFGGAFLIACDAIARTVFAPVELPVGVVTAVLGAPFFLWLLVRKDWTR